MRENDLMFSSDPTTAMSWGRWSTHAPDSFEPEPAGPSCYDVSRRNRGGLFRLYPFFTIALTLSIGLLLCTEVSPALSVSTFSASNKVLQGSRKSQVSTTDRIAALEALLVRNPSDGNEWLNLGSAYLRRAFETGDPAQYPLAQRSLLRAVQLLGTSPDVLSAQTTLALARHQFVDAQTLSTQLLKQRPLSVEGRIARFDAIVELGKYDQALALIEELVDQRASLSTMARLSYIKQLLGDSTGSEMAMRAAVGAAPKDSFDRGVALGYLGDVLMENGKLASASVAYRSALNVAPSLPNALLGEARVSMARGDPIEAQRNIDRLIERIPTPGGLGFRADIARSLGDTQAAVSANQLVDASVQLFRANGSVVDAELAVLLADRGPSGAKQAYETAKRAYQERQTIFTSDALAWSLFVSGRLSEAAFYAKQAIRTDPVVSSVRWHAAAIFAAAGEVQLARRELKAAARNSWFSPSQRPALLALAKKLGVAIPSTSLQSATNKETS